MNFKHSAFIENTPEMREWLEEIGIKPKFIAEVHYSDDCLVVKNGCYVEMPNRLVELYETSSIDCRNNPDLFKAITAIRDDSDYMQWFKRLCTGELYLCRAKNFDRIRNFRHKSKDGWEYHNGLYRKATLEELIEHFKK